MSNELDFHDLEFEVLLCIYSCFILTFFNFVSVWFKRPVYVCLYIPLCLGTATLLYFTSLHVDDHWLNIELVEPRICANADLKQKLEEDLTLMNSDMCLQDKCPCYQGEGNSLEIFWRDNYDVSFTYMNNRTTAAASEPVFRLTPDGRVYNLRKLDWAYDGFSKFNDCYEKVLSIDPEFKAKDRNGFFSSGAYNFLLQLELNYT